MTQLKIQKQALFVLLTLTLTSCALPVDSGLENQQDFKGQDMSMQIRELTVPDEESPLMDDFGQLTDSGTSAHSKSDSWSQPEPQTQEVQDTQKQIPESGTLLKEQGQLKTAQVLANPKTVESSRTPVPLPSPKPVSIGTEKQKPSHSTSSNTSPATSPLSNKPPAMTSSASAQETEKPKQTPTSNKEEPEKRNTNLPAQTYETENLQAPKQNAVVASSTIPAINFNLNSQRVNPNWTDYFEPNGRTRYPARKALQGRAVFGSKVNIPNDRVRQDDREKFQKVFAEIVKAVNREKPTDSRYMTISPKELNERLEDYFKLGKVSDFGAHSIAVKGIAVKRKFADTPCAEFVSEVIRQAYSRAGYDHKEDFNVDNKNPLQSFFSYKNQSGGTTVRNGASVQGLTESLYLAGWIPWSADEYIPPIGAVMAAQRATSPGHIYFIGGHNGLVIVDNGAPRGRDLRQQSTKYLAWTGEYKKGKSNLGVWTHSVFFLPPGMTPQKWPVPAQLSKAN
jgi:hypothetical protein